MRLLNFIPYSIKIYRVTYEIQIDPSQASSIRVQTLDNLSGKNKRIFREICIIKIIRFIAIP